MGNASTLANNGVWGKSDIKAVQSFVAEMEKGISTGEAWKNSMSGATQEAKQFIVSGRKAGQTYAEISESMQASSASAKAATIATTALNMALNTLAVVGISLAIKGFSKIVNYEKDIKENSQKAIAEVQSLNDTFKKTSTSVNEVKNRYAELAQGVKNIGTAFQSQGTLSTKEYAEFLDISNQLSTLYPELTKGYLDNGDALIDLSGDVNTIVESLDKLVEAQKQVNNQTIWNKSDDIWEGLKITVSENDQAIAKLQVQTDNYERAINTILTGGRTLLTGSELYNREHGLNQSATQEFADIFDRAGIDASSIQTYINGYMAYDYSKLTEEQINALKRAYSQLRFEVDNETKQTENSLKTSFTEIDNIIFAWLDSQSETYEQIGKAYGEDGQKIIREMLNNIDYDTLSQHLRNDNKDQFIGWLENTYLQPLTDVSVEMHQKILDVMTGSVKPEEVEQAYQDIINYLVSEDGLNLGEDNEFVLYWRLQYKEYKNDIQKVYDKAFGKFDLTAGGEFSADNPNVVAQQKELEEWIQGLDQEDITIIMNADTFPLQASVEEAQIWLDGLKESAISNAKEGISTIAKSVEDFTSGIKPWIDDLGNAYSSIFYGDNGFDIEAVNADLLEGIRSQFEAINQTFAENGIEDAFDTQALEKFLAVLSNGTTTEQQAQEAFNDYVTSLFYSAEGLKDLNEETANAIEQMMEQAGIINANEVVRERVNAQMEVQANKTRALEAATKDANDTTMEATNEFLQEAQMCNLAKIELADLVATETVFNSQTLSVEDRISKLSALASAYMGAAAQASFLNKVQNTAAGGHGTISAEEAWRQVVDEYSQLEFDPFDYKPPKPEDRGGAGDAGKEAADEYLEAFENELANLDWLHENGYLTEKEYLDQLRILYERYFEGNNKYAKEFFENQRKYLEGLKELYDNALSAITNLLDDEIQKYDDLEEKEKKVFEDEKKANDKKIKALEKVNKQLDKQIKALEKEQKAIQKQNIDPIEEQIKGREEAKKVLEEELSLMQKANDERQDAINLQKAQYELERAMHQKTTLVYTDDDGLGGQMRYRADEKNVREQRENLDNIQYELTIKAKQEEIDLVEQEIDKLNDEKQKYQDQIDTISKKIELLNEQKDANSEIIEGINEQNEALDEQITKIEEEYAKLKEDVESYKDEWKKIAEYAEKAADAALLSSIGFDPELIKNLDPESLKNFDAIYSSILGSLNANDEEMTDALQGLTGKTLGDYLSLTADGIASLDKLDLSTVNTGIQTAKDGVLSIVDAFIITKEKIDEIPSSLDSIIAKLVELQTGGNVNLLLRPEIDAEELNKLGWEAGEGFATVFSSTFSNEAGDLAINFTPIMVDPNTGEFLGVMEPEAFENYCNSIIEGISEDTLNLQIGAEFTGEDAIEQASNAAETVHELHESLHEFNQDDIFAAIKNTLHTELPALADEAFVSGDESILVSGEDLASLLQELGIETTQQALDNIAAVSSSIDDAIARVQELLDKLREADTAGSSMGGVSAEHAKGTVGPAFASGYNGLPTSESNALRSEYGQPELTVYPNGSYELTTTPTLSALPKGTVIFNAEQTRRILKNSGMSGKAYADGNATSSQFKSLAEVMPDKAAIFERFNANLQANLEAIKTNALNIANNTAEIARAAVNTINQSPTVVLNGGINVTCPGVTETEVAKNLGTALSNQLSSIFQGAALRADQWAMRR